MKNARFLKFGSCALARKMNFVISIFDQQDYGLWGLWEVDSSYLAALVALPRQAVQQTIFVIKYSNVFKRKRVCMYSLLRFFVYILCSSSLGGKSIQSTLVDKDEPQESTGFRFLFQSVESKFWLKLSGCTSSSVDISEQRRAT